MKGLKFVVVFALLAMVSSSASASDPGPLQDFCVAINETNGVYVNGKFCKDPKQATEDDFFFAHGLYPRSTENQIGAVITSVGVDEIPGLNTLGVIMGRADYAPNGGLLPPHTHPRATELMLVLEGTLYVGFVTAHPENRLISKTLKAGDVFVFPLGLVHFQINVGKTNAVAYGFFSSQNPGLILVGNAVFGSKPPIDPDVLTRGFQLDKDTVSELQKKFGSS